MFRDSNKMKQQFFFVLRRQKHKENKKTRKTQLNLWNTKKMKFSKGYDLILEPNSNIKLIRNYTLDF
jgi:hypothetical protein